MKFDDMKAFVVVANMGSFSCAASRMRVAQSALSRRIRRLEDQLDLKLLTRHGRGVRPTESGKILLERAEAVLREMQQVEIDVMTKSAEPTGHLRIALPPVTGQALLPQVIEEYRMVCPRVSLDIMEAWTGYIEDLLTAGSVDVAVLYNPAPRALLNVIPLLAEPLFLIAPRCDRHTGKMIRYPKKVSVKQLAKHPLILPGRAYGLRRVVEQLLADLGREPVIALEVEGVRIIKSLVERGMGMSVLSYASAYPECTKDGPLIAIPIVPAKLVWQLCLASRQGLPMTRAVSELRRIMIKEVKALVKNGLWRGRLLVPDESRNG